MDNLRDKDENYWKTKLPEDRYKVLRQKGTEAPFTGNLLHNKESGIYTCGACGNELFSSSTKFDSGSGWPSFYDVMNNDRVEVIEDLSHGMQRQEVICRNCGSHLGHVFPDGPEPTGLRYCINSCSLEFKKQ